MRNQKPSFCWLIVMAIVLSGCAGERRVASVPATTAPAAKSASDSKPVKYLVTARKEERVIYVDVDLKAQEDSGVSLRNVWLSLGGQTLAGPKGLAEKFPPGQKTFKSSFTYVLGNPGEDVYVTFSLSADNGWHTYGRDLLKGSKSFDTVGFTN